MLVALVGIYARQAREAGWLGLVGFVLALVGTALIESVLYIVSTIIPLVAVEAPSLFDAAMTPPVWAELVSFGGFGIGYILLGAATMRAGVLPRAPGGLLIVGVSLFMLSEAGLFGRTVSHALVTVGDGLFATGLVWIGIALWWGPRQAEAG